MPQVVQGPSGCGGELAGVGDVWVGQRLGHLVEDLLGAPVGQAGPVGGKVEVGGGQGDAGAAVGEEHRSSRLVTRIGTGS
jgi:hypothetical protein